MSLSFGDYSIFNASFQCYYRPLFDKEASMMKLSANTLGIFAVTAIATTAFVWMVKRPPVEGQVTQFGMPSQTATAVEKAKDTPELVDEKPAEGSATEGSSSAESSEAEKPEEASSEEAEAEKSKD